MLCYKLKKGVYYRMFGEQLYLRHTDKREDYVFNSTTYDILNIIKKEGICTLQKICAELSLIYDIELEQEDFLEEITMFIDDLVENDILSVEYGENSDGEEKNSITDEILQWCSEQYHVFSACLELTYRCNEKCIHCYVDDCVDIKSELTFDEYRVILDQLWDMGCISLLLTGGEVTLRTDFLKIAEYAIKKGFLVDIFTNGINFTDEHLDYLKELHPNSISFSLYGGTADVHDSITKVKGSFEKTLKRIMMTKCAGIDTYIKSVVIQQNVKDYENLLRLGKRIEVPVVGAVHITPTHQGNSKEEYRLMDIDAYIDVIRLKQKYDIAVDANKITYHMEPPLCGSGIFTVSINPYGDVYPCNSFPLVIGNIRKNKLEHIWNYSEKLNEIRQFSFENFCNNLDCEDRNWCQICMGSAYTENKGKCGKCKDTCLIAQSTRRIYQEKQYNK